MSRDSREKLGLIALTAVIAAGVIADRGLSFPPRDAVNPFGIACLLGAAAAFYARRGAENFVLCLESLLHVTLYTASYSVLMYALAAFGRPCVDPQLAACDAALGVHLPSIVAWTGAHPSIQQVLQLAYNSLLWQTPLVIVLLGFAGRREDLQGFVRQFILSTLACALVFAIAPADGPFAAYGYEPSATQARYLEHLHQLRDGTRTTVTWRGAEGLITFPSFHTCWAILLTWSVRRWWWALAPFAIVNALVIASTLTTGWHYFADVLGGTVVAAGSILLSNVWVRHARRVWESMDHGGLRDRRIAPRPYAVVFRGSPESFGIGEAPESP